MSSERGPRNEGRLETAGFKIAVLPSGVPQDLIVSLGITLENQFGHGSELGEALRLSQDATRVAFKQELVFPRKDANAQASEFAKKYRKQAKELPGTIDVLRLIASNSDLEKFMRLASLDRGSYIRTKFKDQYPVIGFPYQGMSGNSLRISCWSSDFGYSDVYTLPVKSLA